MEDSGLGAAVAELRRSSGLTQEQLGTSLGLTKSQMCKIETGERRMSARELGMVAEALSCDVESLLFPEYIGSARFRRSAKSSGAEADVVWLRRFRRRHDDLLDL